MQLFYLLIFRNLIQPTSYYLYDIDKHDLHYMRPNFRMKSFSEATLFNGDSILIKGEHEMKKCKKQDFSIKDNLLTSIIIK